MNMRSRVHKLAILAAALLGFFAKGCPPDPPKLEHRPKLEHCLKSEHPLTKKFKDLIQEKYSSSYDEDYQKFLEQKNALGLVRILKDKFQNFYIRDYTKILSHCDRPTLQKLAILKQILGKDFQNVRLDDYVNIISGCDKSMLNKLAALKQVLGKDFHGLFLSDYFRILSDDDFMPGKLAKLKQALGNEFSGFYLDPYADILSRCDDSTLDKLIRLRQILGEDFKSWDLSNYVNTLPVCNRPALDRLEKLKQILGKDFQGLQLGNYIALLKHGINPKAITRIKGYALEEIVSKLASSTIPRDLAPNFTHSLEEYSIQVAAQNPVFGADHKKVRNYIKEKLSKKEHCYRKNTDYKEGPDQIDKIKNINILYLIKGYVDYFEKPENIKKIGKMIKKDMENPFSEEGGVVVNKEKGYQFIKLDTWSNVLKNLENNTSYTIPSWLEYVGHVGVFHFHATREDDSEYSGPSGSSTSGLKFLNGDIGVLRQFNEINHYEIDCVVTKLKGNRFNVDLYFRDVNRLLILRRNTKNATVIDLGIFEYLQ